MPKRFGHTVCLFAAVVMTISFVGCRTTASKLANVPGMGWLERGDEGWANFEPAPGLPRPSATSEPTPESGKSTANLASNSTTGSNTRSQFGKTKSPNATSVAGKPRFDPSRYMPNGLSNPSSKGSSTRNNAASNYGDYASAYGKYGPPKPVKNESNIAPQKGPYDVDLPKYASSGAGGSTSGYDVGSKFGSGKYTSPSEPAAKEADSSYDYANRFDNSASRNDTAAAYTANSNSRFGVTPSGSGTSKASAYTPPGFAKSSTASSNSGNRFGDLSTAVESAAQDTRGYVDAARDQLNAAAQGVSSRGRVANQFSDFAKQQTERFSGDVNRQLQPATTNTLDEAKKTFNRYAQPANQAINNAANAAKSPFNSAMNSASDYAKTYQAVTKETQTAAPTNVGVPAGRVPAFTNDATSRFGATAQAVAQPSVDQVKSFAEQTTNAFDKSLGSDQTKSTVGNYAKSRPSTFGETLNQTRETVKGYASAAQDAGRNAMSNVGAAAQNAYPSTSTPNPFLIPVSTDATQNTALPSSNLRATPTRDSVPKSTPTIQRSTTPFRPGSTSTYQGAVTTRKPSIELASNASGRLDTGDQIVLAVGDRYQYPRMLR